MLPPKEFIEMISYLNTLKIKSIRKIKNYSGENSRTNW